MKRALAAQLTVSIQHDSTRPMWKMTGWQPAYSVAPTKLNITEQLKTRRSRKTVEEESDVSK